VANMDPAELRALARRYAQTDPMPGTDWRETLTGRIFRVVIKPLEEATARPLVCYYDPPGPVFCCTLEQFQANVEMPDGTVGPRFAPVA
jgi:hypothetical protein